MSNIMELQTILHPFRKKRPSLPKALKNFKQKSAKSAKGLLFPPPAVIKTLTLRDLCVLLFKLFS